MPLPSVAQTPQIVAFTTTAAPTAAYGSNVTKGDLLVVCLMANTSTPTGLPTDTVLTTYRLIGNLNEAGIGDNYLYCGLAPASGANTVSIGLAASDSGVIGLVDVKGASTVTDAISAISFVQSGVGVDGGSGTQTAITQAFGTNNTAGNLLQFALGTYPGASTPALTAFSDTVSDTWTQVANNYTSSTVNLYLELALSAIGGANTMNGTVSPGGFFDWIFSEITAGTGVKANWATDGGPFTAATGSGIAMTSNLVTTSGANDILLAIGSPPSSHPNILPASGWTLLRSTSYTTKIFYKIVTQPGIYQFSGTLGTSGAWVSNLWAVNANTIFNFVSTATTTPLSNPLVTSNPNDIVLNFVNSPTGGISAGQGGWTSVIGTGAKQAVQYQIPGVTGTFQPGWTQTSGTSVSVIVAFAPTVSGGLGGSLIGPYNFWGGGFN